MTTDELARGLYLAKRRSPEKLVDHYGIIDIGNRALHPNVSPTYPAVYHINAAGLHWDYLANAGDGWQLLGRIGDEDEDAAIERIGQATSNPRYDLLQNNCEQFARWVAFGTKTSGQLQLAGLLLVVGLTVWAMRKNAAA